MLLTNFKPYSWILGSVLLGASLQAATIDVNSIFEVNNLGGLGGTEAAARAISQNGATAGVASDSFGNRLATFNNGTSPTQSFPGSGGDAMATGVNVLGQASGTQWIGGIAFAGRYDVYGNFTLVGGPGSYANGINEAGQLTGMITVGDEAHAFITSAIDGSIIDLGTMPGGHWSSGYGINNHGTVAGYGMVGSNFQAFTWKEGSGFSALNGLGGRNSYAMGLNDLGGVTGHAQNTSGFMRAVLWMEGIAHNLGTLGGNGSYGYGVNNYGQVVGYSWTEQGQMRAFVYANGMMMDLNSLITPNSGWILTQAFAINDAGQIVGSGFYNGKFQAFRLDLRSMLISAFGPGVGGPGGGGPGGLQPDGLLVQDDGSTTNGANGPSGTSLAAVPEPGTWMMALLGFGLIGIGRALTAQRRSA